MPGRAWTRSRSLNGTLTIKDCVYAPADDDNAVASGAAPTFDRVNYGYAQPEAQAITIASTGNSGATISGVALSGDGAGGFTLNKTRGATVTAGSTDSTTYTVRPYAGLGVGTYTATITVTYDGGATATADVSFTVNALPTYAVSVTAGANVTTTGTASQAVNPGVAMTAVVYTANDNLRARPLRLIYTMHHMVGQLTIMGSGARVRAHCWTTTVGTGAI